MRADRIRFRITVLAFATNCGLATIAFTISFVPTALLTVDEKSGLAVLDFILGWMSLSDFLLLIITLYTIALVANLLVLVLTPNIGSIISFLAISFLAFYWVTRYLNLLTQPASNFPLI